MLSVINGLKKLKYQQIFLLILWVDLIEKPQFSGKSFGKRTQN